VNSITVEGNTLIYRSDYNPALVAALKLAIPATDRRWDPARKAWIVAPGHGRTLQRLTRDHLGEDISLPQVTIATGELETRILEIRYIGATKDRGDGQPTAFGYTRGPHNFQEWGAIFPERVLREWFNAEARPDETPTLYATLGIKASATPDEVKSAYRRLARSWHPDVCKEPDAKEQFMRIQRAYEVLRSPATRAKYNAGLALVQSLKSSQKLADRYAQGAGYRPPLRCGLIMAEGREMLGRFVVERILAWQDITDTQGRTLVTSWPMGANAPVEVWQ
jgi:hypothetical protein